MSATTSALPASKLLNASENAVSEMIEGALLAHNDLVELVPHNVLMRRDYKSIKEDRVALISGGGSGHEPAHAGFIGEGMLTAAVLGGVFASPTAAAVYGAICEVTGPKGCLLIVKNYTGDRLNFGIAAEKAKANGLKVEMVIVGDDVAVNAGAESNGTITGRRGLAGTLFVHKVAGAAAEAGESLAEVYAAAQSVANGVGSMGVALTTCTVPGSVVSTRISPGEMELGLGIHGEPGRARAPLKPVDEIAETIIKQINAVLPLSGKRLAVMINNLGGTPLMELYVAARAVRNYLTTHSGLNAKVERMYVGSFMTSLEMQGLMVTCFVFDNPLQIARIDAFTAAPGWPKRASKKQVVEDLARESQVYGFSIESEAYGSNPDTDVTERLKRACHVLIENEKRLNDMDAIVGDGDCGRTIKSGAKAILDQADTLPSSNPSSLCAALAEIIQKSMGGSSGAVMNIMLCAARTRLLEDGATWASGFQAAVEAASFYGGAKEGYRTLLDALIPAARTATEGGSSSDVIAAAKKGAEKTATMRPLAGRSSYLSETQVHGTADPGAIAAALFLESLLQ
jgi:dihydroxyacetone kinase